MRENCTYGLTRGRTYPITRGVPLYSTSINIVIGFGIEKGRKEQSTEFEKVNVGLPLWEDMEKELSGVSIEDKKNLCPL